jgi:hypothetical protein
MRPILALLLFVLLIPADAFAAGCTPFPPKPCPGKPGTLVCGGDGKIHCVPPSPPPPPPHTLDTGEARLWLLDGRKLVEDIGLTPPAADWRVIGVGDFNGDGKADLLWRR